MALATILLLALGLRFYRLGAESLWYDEAYSVWIAALPLAELALLPPGPLPFPMLYTGSGGGLLYHAVLHFWLSLGQSEVAVRSLSALLGVLTVAITYALGRELFGRRAGLLAALLVAASPLHVWYGQEARMYALVIALSALSVLFLVRALRRGQTSDWIGYLFFTTLMPYTHYHAWFTILAQDVFVALLLAREHLSPRLIRRSATPADQGNLICRSQVCRHWLTAQLGLILLSLPGLPGFLSQMGQGWWDWIAHKYGAPGFSELVNTLSFYLYGFTPVLGRWANWGTLLLVAILLLAAVVGWKGRRPILAVNASLVFCVLWLVVPIGTTFLVAQWRPMYVLRYLSQFSLPLFLLLGHGLARLPGRAWAAIGTGALLLAWVPPLRAMYLEPQKEDWRNAVAYIAAAERSGDVIALVDEDIFVPFEYYYRGSAIQYRVSRFRTAEELQPIVAEMLAAAERAWLVESHTTNHDLKAVLGQTPGLAQLDHRSFLGIEVYLYGLAQQE